MVEAKLLLCAVLVVSSLMSAGAQVCRCAIGNQTLMDMFTTMYVHVTTHTKANPLTCMCWMCATNSLAHEHTDDARIHTGSISRVCPS